MGEIQSIDIEKRLNEFKMDSTVIGINEVVKQLISKATLKGTYDMSTMKFEIDIDESSKANIEYLQNILNTHIERYYSDLFDTTQ